MRKMPAFVLSALLAAGLGIVPAGASAAPGGEAPLTLSECLDLAFRNSPELASADQRLSASRAGLLGAYGGFLPNVSTSLGYSHNYIGPKPGSLQYNSITQEFFVLDIASRDYESYDFGISANLTLFAGFARWAALKSQKLGLAASEADRVTTRHQVENAVILAYYDLVRAQMMVELSQSSLDANREQYEQACRAFSMGAVARSDTLRASVRYAEARLALLEADNSAALARVALATLIGRDAAEPLSAEAVDSPQSFAPIDRRQAIGAALDTHPTLKAAAFRYEASQQEIRQAKAGLWPALGASYRYGWGDLDPPDDPLQVFDQDYSYTLGVGLQWDLFDGFRTKQSIKQARANSRIQEYNLELQRRSIVQGVEATLVTLENARQRIELARATVDLATEDLRLARERYRVGAATLLEVTEAEVSLVQGRATEIEGITNYLSALAELERATGLDLSP